MIPVAKKAISRLKELSSQARLLAAEIQKNYSNSTKGTLKENIPPDLFGMIERRKSNILMRFAC